MPTLVLATETFVNSEITTLSASDIAHTTALSPSDMPTSPDFFSGSIEAWKSCLRETGNFWNYTKETDDIGPH